MQEIYTKQQIIFVFIGMCQQILLKFPNIEDPMLVGSLVTTAWRVLRLRMERTAFRYGGYLRKY
jgi:hypothetical protein